MIIKTASRPKCGHCISDKKVQKSESAGDVQIPLHRK